MQFEWAPCENSRFVLLTIDDGPWRKVYGPLFSKHLTQLKSCENLEELEKRFSLIEEKIIWQECLRLLSLKSRLCSEMKKKLSLKEFSALAIQKAIDRCIQAGYLDDLEEIRRLAQREMRRGYGPRWIVAKLRTKGHIPDHFIQEMEKEQIASLQVFLKKRPSLLSMDTQKLFRVLLRRGFDMQTIHKLLEKSGI